jgi:hypothetical protein
MVVVVGRLLRVWIAGVDKSVGRGSGWSFPRYLNRIDRRRRRRLTPDHQSNHLYSPLTFLSSLYIEHMLPFRIAYTNNKVKTLINIIVCIIMIMCVYETHLLLYVILPSQAN